MKDLTTHESLFSGWGLVEDLKSSGLNIVMDDGSYKGSWKLLKHGCILEHQQEAHVKMILNAKGSSKAVVTTEYGTMEIPVILQEYTRDEKRIHVRYKIVDSDDIFDFELTRTKEGGDDRGCN